MSYQKHIVNRQQRKRIVYDWNNPQPPAACDGCGQTTLHSDLRKHLQYRGGVTPVWDGMLVCGRCDDIPNVQLARQVLQPDPLPVKNPRPIQFGDAEFLATDEDEIIVTDDGDGIDVT